MTLTGCSGDGEESSDGDAPKERAEQAVATDAKVGAVRGSIDDATSAKVVSAVAAVVDRWIDGAYGGDYPRSDFDEAFADFTKDARALAVKQPTVMSNAASGPDLDGVDITVRTLRVDVLSPKGKPAAATARVRLRLESTGDEGRTEVVSGRLMLTPDAQGWHVFGFDVSRGEETS